MLTGDQHQHLIATVRSLCEDPDAGGALQRVCMAIESELDGYDWVGVYIAVPGERMLVLGPFQGEPTEHIRIPYGRGICGQSAQTESVFRVDDVAGHDNYLACSIKVKSEIVVPVFTADGDGGRVFVGEVDIDSHQPRAFSDADIAFLTEVAELCGPKVAQIMEDLAPR